MPWGYLKADDTTEAFSADDSSILEKKFASGIKEHKFYHATCDFISMTMIITDLATLKLVRFDTNDIDLIWLRETEQLERHQPLNLNVMSMLSVALNNKYTSIAYHDKNSHTIVFDLLNMLMHYNGCKFNIMSSPLVQEDEEESVSDIQHVPKEFICPISSDVMKDPVVASDGFTYERRYIQQWITCNKAKSPMTNKPLTRLILISNSNLKSLIGTIGTTI